MCTIVDRRNKTPHPQQATGAGCHPIATIALARAITEAAQSRLTHIPGLREDLTWSRYRQEFLCETDNNKSSLAKMSDQPEAVDFGKLCSASDVMSLDMQALLEEMLKRLRKANLRSAIVVDLAVNEIFSVVFVCVPDLEYKTPKGRILYTPGSKMREYLEQHELRSDGPYWAAGMPSVRVPKLLVEVLNPACEWDSKSKSANLVRQNGRLVGRPTQGLG